MSIAVGMHEQESKHARVDECIQAHVTRLNNGALYDAVLWVYHTTLHVPQDRQGSRPARQQDPRVEEGRKGRGRAGSQRKESCCSTQRTMVLLFSFPLPNKRTHSTHPHTRVSMEGCLFGCHAAISKTVTNGATLVVAHLAARIDGEDAVRAIRNGINEAA